MRRAAVTFLIYTLIAVISCGLAQTPAPSPSEQESQTAPAELEPTPVPVPSLVYRVENKDAIFDYRVNQGAVRRMVNDLVTAVTGQPTVAAAWASLVKPTDVVGIKVCANGAPLFSTHVEVVSAIAEGLREAGVSGQNVIVWDRQEELLRIAGYHTKAPDYRLAWSEGNYDPKAVLTAPVSGQLIYGDLDFMGKRGPDLKAELGEDPRELRKRESNLSVQSHVSNILVHQVTKVINVPALSDHYACGLSGAMYNMTVQNVDNWRRLIQEPARGDPEIPEMYADPMISGKVVLHIMDGLVALYAGAPIGNTNYAIQFGTLYASKDPVALDATALTLLDIWRKESKLNLASKDATYVKTAGEDGLGNAEPSKIEVRNVR